MIRRPCSLRLQRRMGAHLVAFLCLCLLAATHAFSSPLYIGTSASDVPSASLGYSQLARAVGAAPDGTIYVGFLSSDKTQLRIARSTDHGATFAPSVVVDTAASGRTFASASLNVSSTGTVYVAYQDSSSYLFLARSSNNGTTFTIFLGLGNPTTPPQGSDVQLQTQGNYVYVAYIGPTGVALAASSDGGVTFALPVSVFAMTAGYPGLVVDPSNGDVIVGYENASLFVRVSHDHGATFDPQQTPTGSAYYSNWILADSPSGRYLLVGGSDVFAGDPVIEIDLTNWTSTPRTFLSTITSHARSMYADACGEVVDSVDGTWVATTNLGASFGTQHPINGVRQTTYINPENYDVLVTYQNGSATLLDVYQNELTGCGPHLNLTASDGHDYARYGQTLNYLVALSASGATADNISVSLSTPGAGLDLASATWTCVGSDNTAICPSSNGTGASLGTVTLAPGTNMNWVVSVPVLASTTDDTIELDANAAGSVSASGSDTDTLVIFRNSFDVANSDGTRGKD